MAYQHQQFLKERGIVQNMSRKGNGLDTELIENFFSVIKREMFYDYEENTDGLIESIHQYFQHYNNNRIKVKPKRISLSPKLSS